MAVMWAITGEGLLVLLVLVAATRLVESAAVDVSDRTALVQFVGLVVALSLLTMLPVEIP